MLRNGDVIPYGICIWSTGVGPTTFITSLPFAKTDRGRLAVDEQLRVLTSVNGSTKKDMQVNTCDALL